MDININADLNKGVESILNALEKVGTVISDTARETLNFIYPLAVKQQIIDGWVSIIAGTLMLITGIILCFYAYKVYQKYVEKENNKTNHWEDNSGLEGLSIFLYVIAGIFIVISPFIIGCSISQVANPEYAAIQSLISQLKTLKP